MTWLGSITAVTLLVGLLVYVFGRRSASKLSAPDALAPRAVLERPAAGATTPAADPV